MGSVKSVSFERVVQDDQVSLVFDTKIPGKAGWVATIELNDGGRLVADRLNGETNWFVNGKWSAGSSMPIFWNGQLSRCTLPQFLDDDVVAIVEENFLARLSVVVDENRTSLR